jgi:hypothetical protein
VGHKEILAGKLTAAEKQEARKIWGYYGNKDREK